MKQEKRKLFEEHLKEQEKERQALNEKKKQLESQKLNPQEDMLYIQKQFRTLKEEMDRLIACFKKKELPSSELTGHYNKMKNYYLEINYVLTSYDRQFYKETLDKINTTIFELKKKAEPKKKFKFSRRDQDFGVKEVQRKAEVINTERKETTIAGVQNKTSEKLTISKECPQGGSFKIVNCDNVEIDLIQKTQILFLKNLKNCIIRAAVTKSAVFVDNCNNCKFQLNCHQLRIHNTYESRFNIFVTSKAIIEDCNKVIFSTYRFEYPDRQRHEEEQNRLNKPNLWREIQDFNWLKENQKSPYYDLEQ